MICLLAPSLCHFRSWKPLNSLKAMEVDGGGLTKMPQPSRLRWMVVFWPACLPFAQRPWWRTICSEKQSTPWAFSDTFPAQKFFIDSFWSSGAARFLPTEGWFLLFLALIYDLSMSLEWWRSWVPLVQWFDFNIKRRKAVPWSHPAPGLRCSSRCFAWTAGRQRGHRADDHAGVLTWGKANSNTINSVYMEVSIGFLKWGNPQIIHFSLFRYKPSILGYLHFRKLLFVSICVYTVTHICAAFPLLSPSRSQRIIPRPQTAAPAHQGAFAMKSWNSSVGIEKFPWWLRFGTCVWCHPFCHEIGMTLDPSRCWWMQLITSSHCRCSMSPNTRMQSGRTPQLRETSRMTQMHSKRRLTKPLLIFARSLWKASWTPCGSCSKHCQCKTWICRRWGGLFWSACSIPCTPICARRIGFSTWFIFFILYGHI